MNGRHTNSATPHKPAPGSHEGIRESVRQTARLSRETAQRIAEQDHKGAFGRYRVKVF